MNICSCVVYAKPGQGPEVAARLAELPGVEVHGGAPECRLVVTLEDTPQTMAADTLGAIGQLAGVLNTVLIYHYGDDEGPAQDGPLDSSRSQREIQAEEHPHEHHQA
jgi:nitrate reductase NapD